MSKIKPLRVLVVGISLPPETFLTRLFQWLASSGVEITLASSRKPDVVASSHPGIQWFFKPAWNITTPIRLFNLVRMTTQALIASPTDLRLLAKGAWEASSWRERVRGFYRLAPLAGRRWDIIYFPWNSGAIDHLPLFAIGTPVVISCRGSQVNVVPNNPERMTIREGLNLSLGQAAAVHCVSDDIRRELVGLGIENANTWVIPPAVDTDFFRPSALCKPSDGLFRIVATGRLVWVKGYEYSLLAMRHLLDEGTRAHLDIIGNGPDRNRLLFTIQDLGLEDHVTLLGHQSPQDVRNRLQLADTFLLSSLREGFCNAAVEALACGLPIVATNCGGVREAITDGVEGFLVPVRDPKAMAAALSKLASDRVLRENMRLAARARAVRDFSKERHVHEWLALFQSVLANRSRLGCPSEGSPPVTQHEHVGEESDAIRSAPEGAQALGKSIS